MDKYDSIFPPLAAAMVRRVAWDHLGIELHQDTVEELLEAIYLEGKRDVTDEFLRSQQHSR